MPSPVELLQREAMPCARCHGEKFLYAEGENRAYPLFQKDPPWPVRVMVVAEAPNFDDSFDRAKQRLTVEPDTDPSGAFTFDPLASVGLRPEQVSFTAVGFEELSRATPWKVASMTWPPPRSSSSSLPCRSCRSCGPSSRSPGGSTCPTLWPCLLAGDPRSPPLRNAQALRRSYPRSRMSAWWTTALCSTSTNTFCSLRT